MSVHVQGALPPQGVVAVKAGVLGAGKQEVAGPYLIGAVILGVTGVQVLPLGVGGKVDVAGAA